MKVKIALVERGNITKLVKVSRDAKITKCRIFLSNENSMIDVNSIEKFSLDIYSVDLDSLQGNPLVIRYIKEILTYHECAYFPGTLLEKRDIYYAVTMPIIYNGKIILKRRKILGGIVYISDNWINLARKLIPEKMDEFQGTNKATLFMELYKELYKIVRNKCLEESINSIKSIEIEHHRVLPIICNEIQLIPRYYRGKPISLIVHSSDSLFHNEKSRLIYYKKINTIFREKSIVEDEYYIAIAEIGYSPFANIIKISSNDKLKLLQNFEI
jgi:hypothetical protein